MKRLIKSLVALTLGIAAVSLLMLLVLNSTAKPIQASYKDGSYVIGFYNLENLFDTIDDPNREDYQFLPDGDNQWTMDKYQKKLHNMASAIKAMAEENGMYHAILGVAEVENNHALQDLLAQPELQDSGYKGILKEGGDGRGIDVALIYRPDVFDVKETESIPYNFRNSRIDFYMTRAEQRAFSTRDVLMVRGLLEGEMFAIYVAHLPSRVNDKPADLRNRGAEIIYQHAMTMQNKYPGIKIVVMGDMNDDPTDESMTDFLMGRENPEGLTDIEFFNPFLSMLKAGYGSMEYRGQWQIFDQILVNNALANAPKGGFRIQKIEADKYYGKVFNAKFLTQQDGRYAGTPYRTFSNGEFINGYSDHYPTFIVVSR